MARATSAQRKGDYQEGPKPAQSRRPVLRKVVKGPEDHADRPGQTLETRSHEAIQRWAEERQAQPSSVPGSEHGGHLGVLRLNFPGYGGGKLVPVSWDDWFRAFDARGLSFIYQETKRDGTQSNFFRLLNPKG